MRFKRKKVHKSLDNNKLIKNHPLYIFLSGILIGFTAAFFIIIFGIKYLGFEFEKKGTYISYKDFYLELNNNYVQKINYENILLENNNLKMSLEKYRTRDTDVIVTEISRLKEELNFKTEQLIQYTTSMRVSLDGNNIQRNLDTERYRQLSEDINLIRKSIESLYEKI